MGTTGSGPGATGTTGGATVDEGREVARTAADQGGQVVATAGEQAREVTGTAAQGAKDVASTAKEQMSGVTSEAAAQARNLMEESKTQLKQQAQSQTDRIASQLRQIGDQIQALVDGRADEAGPVGDYARQAVQTMSRYAGQVENRGFDGMMNDVQRFARRRPGAFLLGAAIAGFGIGRVLRNAGGGNGTDSGYSGYSDVTGTGYAVSGMADPTLVAATPPLVDVSDVDDTATMAPTSGTYADSLPGQPYSSGTMPPAGAGA
jgi:hypothetical protein